MVTSHKTSNTKCEILVEVPSADLEKYLNEAASVLSNDLEIEGFRKGHAPRSMVERAVGADKLYSEGAEIAVRRTFSDALKEAGLDPGTFLKKAVPEIQVTKIAPNNPLEYKVTLHAPFFELASDYEKIASKIRNEERQKFEEHTKVEEKEIESTLQWLVKNRKTDAVNDDFAKSLGNFADLAELKKSIRDGICLEKENQERLRVRHAILRGIILESRVEVPDRVIERELLRVEEEFKQNIQGLGLDFNTYLSKINKKKEELYDGWREQARERLEKSFALDSIAERKEIKETEDEIAKEAQKILNHYRNSKDAGKEINTKALREYTSVVLRNEKTFQFLESL